MEVHFQNGPEFAKLIEEDEDTPVKNIHLLNGPKTLYKGSVGDFVWTCIYRLKGG